MNGTLVNPATGMRVQGWMAEDVNGQMIVSTAATPTDLVIPVGSKDPAKETTNVSFACNLNKNTPEILEGASPEDIKNGTWGTEQKIYDSFGNEHMLSVTFRRVVGTPNQWEATVNIDEDNADFTQTRVGLGSTDGMGTSFAVPDSNVDEEGNPYRQTLNINLGTIGSFKDTITQSSSKSTTKAFYQDGYTMGYLDNFKIDSSGVITGVYSNGTIRTIGQIAMASFTNQQGLEKAGDNTYVESNNSGMARIGESGVAGKGTLMAGALEMSNVDLSEQLTDMIVTQRGFQSNAKTIQTADTLLETVLSLKR